MMRAIRALIPSRIIPHVFENAATEQTATIVKRADLPRGDGTLRMAEGDDEATIAMRPEVGRFRLGAVSRLGIGRAERFQRLVERAE